MRIALRLTPHVTAGDPVPGPAKLARIAEAAEAAGFDAVFVTDHPAPPARLDARGGHHDLDPFVTLAWVAARTSRLRLLTYLAVLPYRNPFLLARSTSTLDLLSDGRLVLGVGVGYLEAEFAALGVPFEDRNELADEALEVLRELWDGDVVTRAGRRFDAPGNQVVPTPPGPRPPIWVGGNSRRAMRRAVQYGDAWMPLPSLRSRASHLRTAGLETLDDLRSAIGRLHDQADRAGRERPPDVVFTPLFRETYAEVAAPDRLVEGAAALHEVGVTYAVTQLVTESVPELLEHVAAYGETVVPAIARFGAPGR